MRLATVVYILVFAFSLVACGDDGSSTTVQDVHVADDGEVSSPDAAEDLVEVGVGDTVEREDSVAHDTAGDTVPDATPEIRDVADSSEPDTVFPPGQDSDGDGLEDWWEVAAGDLNLLDPADADTDGDGVADGDEDPDQDGLSNAVEQLAGQAGALPESAPPHPFQPSLLVELDAMMGKELSASALALAVEAYAAVPVDGVGAETGIGLHVLLDQTDLSVAVFDGTFEQRHAFLRDHGPSAALIATGLPVERMIHVAMVSRRNDMPFRGGEVVTHGSGDIAATGVLVYYDALDELHPQCGFDDPYVAPITLDEALAGAFAHEIGHTLQLGHDTEVVDGANHFNLMSVPTTCGQARQRFHGEGNADASLGATEAAGAARFSHAAVALMDLGNRLSVETADLVGGAGVDM